jgi:hypothetical protein
MFNRCERFPDTPVAPVRNRDLAIQWRQKLEDAQANFASERAALEDTLATHRLAETQYGLQRREMD